MSPARGDAGTLRVIGTVETLPDVIQRRAIADLGFPIRFTVLDGEACLRRGVTEPESFDVYDQWFYSVDLLWTAGAIEPIRSADLRRWSQVQPAGDGHGASPAKVLFVQHDQRLGPVQTPHISMLPTACNADAFACVRDGGKAPRPDEEESWGWFFDPRWHGRCTIGHDPAGAAVELALAARAAGVLGPDAEPTDLGKDEIDCLFEQMIRRRKGGHFTRSWTTHEESVRQMAAPGCVLGAIWSPAFYELRARGLDLRYAVPREGYRGWQGGLCLSAALTSARREMAYAYLNWWLDGVPGAILARQGYYMSVVEPVHDRLSSAEWNYWYGGKPAISDLPGMRGQPVVRAGESREGGSHQARIARITAWSTLMPEHNYLARRWRDFWAGSVAG